MGMRSRRRPPQHPYATLFRDLGVRSFLEVRERTRALAETGQRVGRLIEVRDASGTVVNYRSQNYRSLIEAGCDKIVAEFEQTDPDRAERIRSRLPLVERFESLERLAELSDAVAARSSPSAPLCVESEAPAPRNPVPYDEFSAAGRSYEMAERTRQAIADRRAFLISRAAEIEAEKNRDVTWSPNTDWAEKVQLLDKLARWADKNPELAEQCRVWEGDHGRR